jgi:hypothetical protein
MMRATTRLAPHALLPALCLALAGCGKAPESTMPAREQGSGTATLTWSPPAPGAATPGAATPGAATPGADPIAGYRIYVGTAPDALHPEAVVADPGATRYVVRKLPKGPHYFAVRSYDADGVESDATPVVSKTID